MTDQTGDLRSQAEKRIRNRRQFWGSAATMLVIFLILVAIWGFTSGWSGYFWPMWPGFAFVIAIIFQALSVFGPLGRPVTQAQIDDEVRRMGGGTGTSA